MAKKSKYRYKRNFIEEITSKIKLIRHNIKYSIELIKTSGKEQLFDVLLFNFKKEKEFEVNLSITAIIRNEAPYIKEWLEFHKLVGVERFYIYDNESTDNIKEVLQPYIEKGEVVYKYFPGEKMQFAAYNDSINVNRYNTKYMAFIDLDEFIVPVEHNSILDFINDMQSKSTRKIAAIGMSWLIHGFNAHKEKQEGLLTELYPKCEYDSVASETVKSIVNPRSILKIYNPHYALHVIGSKIVNSQGKPMHGPYTKPSHNKIRVNHYYTKSYEEHIARINKGKADGNTSSKVLEYQPDLYSVDIDEPILKYLTKLKEKMKEV